MKIRGKLVFSAILSMAFMAFILFTYVFTFIGKISYQNIQYNEYFQKMFQKEIEKVNYDIQAMASEKQADEEMEKVFDVFFSKGWAVFNREEMIFSKGLKKEITYGDLLRRSGKRLSAKKKTIVSSQDGDKYFSFPLGDKDSSMFVLGKLSFEPIENSVYKHFLKGLVTIFLIGMISVAFIVYMTASKLVIRPMMRISEAACRMTSGDYSRAVASGETYDESQKLAKAVDDMMVQLKEYHDDVEDKMRKAYEENVRHQKNLIIAQRLAATGRLAAGIAHEINNPLGGMINAVNVLQKETKDERKKIQDYLELIEEGLTRIRMTVKKILQFQQSDHSLAPAPLKIVRPIEKALAFVAHKLSKKNIRVKKDFSEDSPGVMGNEMELQQVFLNIFMNAADAIEKNGEISIGWKLAGKEVIIEIDDTGCGMSEEELKQIFDFFYTTKTAGEGTGLGLSIVYNIIKNHRGNIEFKSERSKGTKVSLTFPLAEIKKTEDRKQKTENR